MTKTLCRLDIDYFNAFTDMMNDIILINDSENVTFYQYLLEKTDVDKHTNAILKHIETIDNYISSQYDNIKENRFIGSIEYSKTIFANIENIYNLTFDENKKKLKMHLLKLVILYEKRKSICNDHFKNMALEIQKNINNNTNSEPNMGGLNIDKLLSPELLGNILSKVSTNESLSQLNTNDIEDPSKLINNILSSGIVTDIIDMVSKHQ